MEELASNALIEGVQQGLRKQKLKFSVEETGLALTLEKYETGECVYSAGGQEVITLIPAFLKRK